MVTVSKSGRIPWERQQPFGCNLALHVRLDGDGGQQPHPLPFVVQQGLLVVVVGLAHGGKLVGGETAEVFVCEVDDREGKGQVLHFAVNRGDLSRAIHRRSSRCRPSGVLASLGRDRREQPCQDRSSPRPVPPLLPPDVRPVRIL